jgi:hypothetical protein
MELIITLYQEKADQAIDEMLKAWDQYEATKSAIWLHLYREYEARATRYLMLLEEARAFA